MYKDLSEEDWAGFIEKCESKNFAVNSEYMQWLRSKNELDHHLGNTGYARKQRKWQQEDERLAQQGLENPHDNFHGWLGPFMRARSKLIESDNISFYSQSTAEVAQRALRESSEDPNGERENDALSKALQNKEQRGHVHGVSCKVTWKEGFLQHKSMYRNWKMTSIPHVDVEELKRQLIMEVLVDLRPILEASGIQFCNTGRVMSDEEHRSSLASTVAGGGPSLIKPDMIDNLAQPIACDLILLVGGSFQMEVGRGLVYPR
jgi:hypothetical protein